MTLLDVRITKIRDPKDDTDSFLVETKRRRKPWEHAGVFLTEKDARNSIADKASTIETATVEPLIVYEASITVDD